MFRNTFGQYFKVDENGKVIANDPSGNLLLSKKNMGTPADPDEALALLVDMYPQKDAILKANTGGGTGNTGGGGHRGNGRFVKRADFEALTPAEQASTAAAQAKGEVTIVD